MDFCKSWFSLVVPENQFQQAGSHYNAKRKCHPLPNKNKNKVEREKEKKGMENSNIKGRDRIGGLTVYY